MKSKAVMKLFEGFLNLIDEQVHENDQEIVVVGRGVIDHYVTKLIMLQKFLKTDSLTFSITNVKNYDLYEEDLSNGCYPVFIYLEKNRGITLEFLKKTMRKAEKEYVKICENELAYA